MSAQLSYSSTYMFESSIVKTFSNGSVRSGSSLLLYNISFSLLKVKHLEPSSQYVFDIEFCFETIEFAFIFARLMLRAFAIKSLNYLS